MMEKPAGVKRRKASALILKTTHNIKRFRMKVNLTQEQLADKTGIAIARCESGKYDMTLTTLDVVSKALNIEAYQLLK